MRLFVTSVLAFSFLSAAGKQAAFSQSPAPAKTDTPPSVGVTDDQVTITEIPTTTDTATTIQYLQWLGMTTAKPDAIAPPASFTEFTNNACNNAAPCAKNRYLYIIHFVDWAANNGSINLVSSQWFLYRFDSKTKYVRIDPKGKAFPDLYDIDNGVLVSISRLKIDPTDAGSANSVPPPLNDTITVTHTTPTWLAGLQTLVESISGVKPAAAGGRPPGVPIYKATITMQPLSGDNTARPFSIGISSAATGPTDTGPSTCKHLSRSAKCTFTFSASIAQRQYLSFGLNIVPYGPVEHQYSVDNPDSKTQIGTLKVNPDRHSAVYAVADFFPFGFLPHDTTNYPYLQAGLPVTGAALRMPYIGMAQHIPFTEKFLSLSAFGGVVFMKQSRPKTLLPGAMITSDQLTADLYTNRAIKVLWGIEVPISSFTGAFTAHKFK